MGSITGSFRIIDLVDKENWPPQGVSKLMFQVLALCHFSDEGLMLEMSAFKFFMVASLCYQLS